MSCTNIPCAFHSTCYTMPNFSTPSPCTSTLRTPLTKLPHNNIYLHCVYTNKIPLRSINTVHTAHASITHEPLNPHHAILNLVCTPVHQYFPRITILHRVMLNLVCTPVHQYFPCITILHRATPNLSAPPAHQYFPCIATLHHAMPNLSAHTCAPIFFAHYDSTLRNAKF
jgi:hypothetical protein